MSRLLLACLAALALRRAHRRRESGATRPAAPRTRGSAAERALERELPDALRRVAAELGAGRTADRALAAAAATGGAAGAAFALAGRRAAAGEEIAAALASGARRARALRGRGRLAAAARRRRSSRAPALACAAPRRAPRRQCGDPRAHGTGAAVGARRAAAAGRRAGARGAPRRRCRPAAAHDGARSRDRRRRQPRSTSPACSRFARSRGASAERRARRAGGGRGARSPVAAARAGCSAGRASQPLRRPGRRSAGSAAVAEAAAVGAVVLVLRRRGCSRAPAASAHSPRRLPDALDLLAACVEGGATIDHALARSRSTSRRASARASACAAQLRSTRPRREVLRALGRQARAALDRAGHALAAADELGSPLASTLTEQAAMQRELARLGVRERAAAAGPKIALVVAVTLCPPRSCSCSDPRRCRCCAGV